MRNLQLLAKDFFARRTPYIYSVTRTKIWSVIKMREKNVNRNQRPFGRFTNIWRFIKQQKKKKHKSCKKSAHNMNLHFHWTYFFLLYIICIFDREEQWLPWKIHNNTHLSFQWIFFVDSGWRNNNTLFKEYDWSENYMKVILNDRQLGRISKNIFSYEGVYFMVQTFY